MKRRISVLKFSNYLKSPSSSKTALFLQINLFIIQVLRFYGYFKESVVESRFENYKIRKLIVLYHLEDHSIMISEPRQVNSGTPQGVFLKRQMVLKQDGSGTPMLPTDFRVGLDVGILGRSIRIYDCDQYTREFFDVSFLKIQQ